MKPILFLLLSVVVGTHGFVPSTPRTFTSSSALNMVPPLFKGKDYEQVVNGLMTTKGLSRKEAETEYNMYLDNPTNYALMKGEEYYKNLGYKSLMEGVIGEAEKEGRGDEVRERIEKFKRQSQIKATAVLVVFFSSFIYLKEMYPLDLSN